MTASRIAALTAGAIGGSEVLAMLGCGETRTIRTVDEISARIHVMTSASSVANAMFAAYTSRVAQSMMTAFGSSVLPLPSSIPFRSL